MALEKQLKSNVFLVALAVFCVLCLIVVVHVFLQSKQKGFGSHFPAIPSSTYVNSRLNYTLTLPEHYRVATDITRLLNTTGLNPIQPYTPVQAEYVVVTASDAGSEAALTNRLESF